MASSEQASVPKFGFSDLSRRLAAVGRALAEAREPLDVYRTLRKFVAECLAFDTFLVTTLDHERGLRECAYCWSAGAELDTSLFDPLPLNDTPASRALVADEPVLCEDYPASVEAAGGTVNNIGAERDPREARSVLILPMASGGRVVGSMQLQSYARGVYVLSDAVPLAAVADHAAAAVESLRLQERGREEWERTFDAMTDAIVLVDSSDHVRRANRAFWRLVGHDENALGHVLTDLMHREGSSVDTCEVCVARRSGREGTFLVSPNELDGRDYKVTISRVEAPRAGFAGMVEVMRDLTDLHVAEAAVASRQAVLDSVLRSTTDILALLDLSGRAVWINDAGAQLGGVPAEKIAGRDVREFMDPEDVPVFEQQLLAVRLGEAMRFDRSVPLPNDRRVMLDCVLSPVVEGGRVTGVLATVRDVTEQRAAIERAAEGEKLRALGQLASGVAHDFNNLLASILGNVQLLKRSEIALEASSARKLGAIERAARDGAETVRRIQNFTRAQAETASETLRVVDLLQQAVDLSRPRWKDQAQAQGAPVQIFVGAVEPSLSVSGNGTELREVLTNIIINAVDAMPTGGHLTLDAERREGRAVLRVSDTGEGMDEATRRRIFEPFFTTRGPQNSGLGLAVSYGIVRRHGGDIEVESRVGGGTTFIVRLPTSDTSARITGSFAIAAQLQEPPLDKRVLVVDDEPSVRDVVADALTEAGAEVVTVDTGEQAVEALAAGRFDLVVTDLGLPGINGWDVARAARRAQPEARILLLTGWGEDAAADGPGRLLVDQVLAKPIDIDDLVKAARSSED